MTFDPSTHHRTPACWRLQSCASCTQSKHDCGWCPMSNACVPASSLTAPVSQGNICPHPQERYELRTKALGCGCSTATLLSIIVTVFATLAALLLIYGISVVLKSINPFLGTGISSGTELEVKEDGTRASREWHRGGIRHIMRKIWKPKPSLSSQSEQEAVTERSRLLRLG